MNARHVGLAPCWLAVALAACGLEQVHLPLPPHEGANSAILAVSNDLDDPWHWQRHALSEGLRTNARAGARLMLLLYGRSPAELAASSGCDLVTPDARFSLVLEDGAREWRSEPVLNARLAEALVPMPEACVSFSPCTSFQLSRQDVPGDQSFEVKALLAIDDQEVWAMAGNETEGEVYRVNPELEIEPVPWSGSPPIGAARGPDGTAWLVALDGTITRTDDAGAWVPASTSSASPAFRAWLAPTEIPGELYFVTAARDLDRYYRLKDGQLSRLAEWDGDRSFNNIAYSDGAAYAIRRPNVVLRSSGRAPSSVEIDVGPDQLLFALTRISDGRVAAVTEEGEVYLVDGTNYVSTPKAPIARLRRAQAIVPLADGFIGIGGTGELGEWRLEGGFCPSLNLAEFTLRAIVPWRGGYLIGTQADEIEGGPAAVFFAAPAP